MREMSWQSLDGALVASVQCIHVLNVTEEHLQLYKDVQEQRHNSYSSLNTFAAQ